MIFTVFESDYVVQVGDKIRLSFQKTFITPGQEPIVEVRIKPSSDDLFYVVADGVNAGVTDGYYLDWIYLTPGTKEITLEIDYGTIVQTSSFSYSLNCITESEDKLFSSDNDLVTHQHDILKYIPDGRSSWKFVHRRSQALILSGFDEEGIVNNDGSKISKDQVIDISEVKELSIYKTLRLIFESISNAPDDYFMKKAKHWEKYESSAKVRCVTRLDFDKSGSLYGENRDNFTISAGRR